MSSSDETFSSDSIDSTLFCAVCCKLLYSEESTKLVFPEQMGASEIHNILWPCLQYGQDPITDDNDRIFVCKTHRIFDDKTVKYVGYFLVFKKIILARDKIIFK